MLLLKDGYHELESMTEEEEPIIHYAQIPFPQSFANFESEQSQIISSGGNIYVVWQDDTPGCF